MDQDFHYYGTHRAARIGGFDSEAATRIALAANFIDFLSNSAYAGRWRLVTNTAPADRYDEVATLGNPRYTFQGLLSTGVSPEDGLWCSYHFTPGNYHYDDLVPAPGTTDASLDNPSTERVHGPAVAAQLPPFQVRSIRAEIGTEIGRMLNRPQSALSRSLVLDTIECADTGNGRLRQILSLAVGGEHLAADDTAVERFRQLLIGVRAHVLADTWAHQDWSGIPSPANTYWDVDDAFGRQAIEYDDGTTGGWTNVVLSPANVLTPNLQASPTVTTIGHGWMGHFPDYSFASYRYRPCWQDEAAEPLVRHNPTEYRSAFLELCSLFSQTSGTGHFDPDANRDDLARAQRAIAAPCVVDDRTTNPRRTSAQAWLDQFPGDDPDVGIDCGQEPDPNALPAGVVERPSLPLSLTRYGDFTVTIDSDLYLFQVAADYHFHVVRSWLARHGVRDFSGGWSVADGPFDRADIDRLVAQRPPDQG